MNTTACTCPQCGSENTQPARMVVAAGTTNTQGQAMGIEMDHADVGYASFQSTSQTQLAAQLDPGPKPSSGVVAALIGIVILLAAFAWFLGTALDGNNGVGIFSVGFTLFGGLCVVDYFRRKPLVRAWPERYRLFLAQWVCWRCGTVYIPAAIPHD